jgi:hypothetical protein
VIIGGLIASVAPVCAIFLDTRRWKLEKQLERLKEERSRLEQLLSETLPRLAEAMAKGFCSHVQVPCVLSMAYDRLRIRPGAPALDI